MLKKNADTERPLPPPPPPILWSPTPLDCKGSGCEVFLDAVGFRFVQWGIISCVKL